MPRFGRRTPNVEDQNKKDVLAGEVRERYEKAMKAVRPEIHNYWENYLFLEGDQWIYYNPDFQRIDRVPREGDRYQATLDRLAPATRTIISKLNQRELTFEVPPSAADDATRHAARLAEARLEEKRREHRWEELREQASIAAWKGGTAAICVEWDPNAGERLADDFDEDPLFAGDTKETVLTLPEIAVQPGVQDAETALWWIRAQAIPPAEAKSTYGLDKEPEADVHAGAGVYTGKIMPVRNRNFAEHPDLCLVLTYFERPHKDNPKGQIVTVIGNQVVDGPKPWYFPFKDRLNFVLQRETMVENQWQGSTVLTVARPMQVAYNAAWTSLLEHLRLASNTRLAMPFSAMDMIDQLTDLPGEILPYPDQSERPGYVQPGDPGMAVIRSLEMLPGLIDDTLGVHQVSRGDAPPNIESGYGLSVLVEQDETPVGRMVKEIAGSFGRLASMVLQLEEANVTHTKTSKIQSPSGTPMTQEWLGKDLLGQTEAVVPVGAITPRSRAALQAFADKAMQMGLIQNIQQYTKLADMPDQRDIIQAVAPDVDKARRENYLVTQGEVPLPALFDDDQVHIDEHNAFRKTALYENLPPEFRKILDTHVKAHETQGAEKAGRQEAKGAISPGLAMAPDRHGTPPAPPEAMMPPPSQAVETPPDTAPPTVNVGGEEIPLDLLLGAQTPGV